MVLATEPGEAGACALENVYSMAVAMGCSGGVLLVRLSLLLSQWPTVLRRAVPRNGTTCFENVGH
jgi:hypothetical protein